MSPSEQSLKKRQRLGFVVRWMSVLLVLAFLFVLFRGIGSTGVSNSSNNVKNVGGQEANSVAQSLADGETGLRRFSGKRIWITRLSAAQRAQAVQLTQYMLPEVVGCDAEQAFCALIAATDRSGIELSFIEAAPAQLPVTIPWYGGFVNPTNGAVYDRLGRAYKLGTKEPQSLQQIIFE